MIAPTLACMDYLQVAEDIRMMDAAGVDSFHIDIMDGHFVPNLCLNFDIAAKIRTISQTAMDVHLMATNPMDYIGVIARTRIEYACAHLKACGDPRAFLRTLKSTGVKAGLAMSPTDRLEDVAP